MNLNGETVVIRYRNGSTVTGCKQFIDVFSKTVIIKRLDDNSYHNVSFDSIDYLILKDAKKEPKVLERKFTIDA